MLFSECDRKAIITKKELVKQQQQLNDAVSKVHSKFKGLIELLNDNRINNEAVFKQLQEDLEQRIPTMGLDEDQEIFIYQKVDETIQNSVAREESVQGVKAAFKEIENDLSVLLKQ